MILHWRIRTGSDSISSDQDWTRTEKFHSPLISVGDLMWSSEVTRASVQAVVVSSHTLVVLDFLVVHKIHLMFLHNFYLFYGKWRQSGMTSSGTSSDMTMWWQSIDKQSCKKKFDNSRTLIIAQIIALHKSGPTYTIFSYRPISILPSSSNKSSNDCYIIICALT